MGKRGSQKWTPDSYVIGVTLLAHDYPYGSLILKGINLDDGPFWKKLKVNVMPVGCTECGYVDVNAMLKKSCRKVILCAAVPEDVWHAGIKNHHET